MNTTTTTTQRLTAGFAAAIASAITLGAVLSLFSTPIRAANVEPVQQTVIISAADAQR